MVRKPQAKLKSVKVSFKTPFLNVEGNWEADENEQRAAWELYVELVTRIAVEELKPGEGLLREALSSLYSLFAETRKILRNYGPSIAKPKGKGNLSFGFLAVSVLNSALRPVLAYWHPILLEYENTRKVEVSSVEHERIWKKNKNLRDDLNKLRDTLKVYSLILAEVAGIAPIETKR
jgi:hypothetical protein